MTEYIVISDDGYEGYGLRYAFGDQELYEEVKNKAPDSIEYVFRTSDQICVEIFLSSYEREQELTRNKILAKLTPAEIEFLGLK